MSRLLAYANYIEDPSSPLPSGLLLSSQRRGMADCMNHFLWPIPSLSPDIQINKKIYFGKVAEIMEVQVFDCQVCRLL